MDRITKSVTGEFSGCLDLVHRMNYRGKAGAGGPGAEYRPDWMEHESLARWHRAKLHLHLHYVRTMA